MTMDMTCYHDMFTCNIKIQFSENGWIFKEVVLPYKMHYQLVALVRQQFVFGRCILFEDKILFTLIIKCLGLLFSQK